MEMVNQFRTLIAGLFNNKQEKEERQGDGEVVKLKQENEELKRTVDTLTIKNREIQQLMVQKIRETDKELDNIVRKAYSIFRRSTHTHKTGVCVLILKSILFMAIQSTNRSVQDDGLDAQDSARIGLKQIADMAESVHAKFIQETMEGQSGTRCMILIPLGKRSLMELPVEFVEPDSDLVNLNELQKEEIAGFVQLIPKKKETGKKILIIDDSDQIRWFLKLALGKEYQIFEARNGEEGVIMAKKEHPDGILCDVMMPVKDGFTTCREIKTNPATSQTVVIMLTAKVENEDVIAGIEAGADDYITKPFDLEVLRSKLISQLKRREQMRAFYTQSATDTEDAVVAVPAPLNEIEAAGNVFMNKIVKIIEEHLDDPCFDAKFLADEMSMSIPTLYRRVKAFSNCSILELTRSVRIKHAAELILQQRYSIIEVCEMVGFNDMATFRKRFTEQYGVNPSKQPSLRKLNFEIS